MTEQAERIEGLDNNGVRQVTVISGRTSLGMIAHLLHPERFWFQQVLTGRAGHAPPGGAGRNDDQRGDWP